MPGLRVDVLRRRWEPRRRPQFASRACSPVEPIDGPAAVPIVGASVPRAVGHRTKHDDECQLARAPESRHTKPPRAVAVVGKGPARGSWGRGVNYRGAYMPKRRHTLPAIRAYGPQRTRTSRDNGRGSAAGWNRSTVPAAVSIVGERFATEGAACAPCARCGVLPSRGPARCKALDVP